MEQRKELAEAREEFFKLLPIIPVWLTFIGAIKIFIDYYKYNINIFHYLDIQEIITLFTNDLMLYFLASNAGLFFYSYVFDDLGKSVFVYKNYDNYKIPVWVKALLYGLRAGIPILLLGYVSTLIIGYNDFSNYMNSVWIIIVNVIVSLLALQLFISTCNNIFVYIKQELSYPIFIIYRFYIFFLLFVTYYTYFQILNGLVKNKKDTYIGSYITTENQTINIDGNYRLIGRTKNYFFIYSPKDNCTEVIPASSVKSTFIKNKEAVW